MCISMRFKSLGDVVYLGNEIEGCLSGPLSRQGKLQHYCKNSLFYGLPLLTKNLSGTGIMQI